GYRDALESGLRRRRATGTDLAQPVRRADIDLAGENLRPVPAERYDCARLRRRHCGLRSEPDHYACRENAAHERRLQPVRRASGDRCDRHRDLAWPGCDRGWEVRRAQGWWVVSQKVNPELMNAEGHQGYEGHQG